MCTELRTRAERTPRTPRTGAPRTTDCRFLLRTQRDLARQCGRVQSAFALSSAQTASMEWCEEDMLTLIQAYKSFPVLWNPSDKEYFKKPKKMDAWRDIGAVMDQSESECKRKIISLLSSYRREKAKEKNSTGTGKGKFLNYKYVSHIVGMLFRAKV